MDGAGARAAWSQITGATVEKPVVIVLDDLVYTFPTINERHPERSDPDLGQLHAPGGGRHRDGLKSGALPAPVSIVEERTVGPSLGAGLDQLRARSRSC